MGESRPVSIADTNQDCDFPALPYKALALEFQNEEQKFQIVTGHFTWTPRSYDTDLSVSRAKVVYDFLAKSNLPFVLTGDFNVNYNTITCRQFEPIARNIGAQLRIKNSINPEKHRATWLFPEGIPCDQVFTSYDIDIYGFQLLRKTLSDHFGLELEFELSDTIHQPIGGLFEYSH